MTSDDLYDGVTRRSVLRTGAVTAGAVTIGAAGAAANHDDDHDQGGNGDNGGGNGGGDNGGNGGKQGGRAQADGDVRRNEPFTLSSTPSGTSRNASCMSDESAEQMYLEYDIQYCDDDDDDDDATLYVIPDEAPLVQDQVYEFRAVQECKASDNQLVALGPSNQECEGN